MLIPSGALALPRLVPQISLLAYFTFMTLVMLLVLSLSLAACLSFWAFHFLLLDSLPPSSTARKILVAIFGTPFFLTPLIIIALTVSATTVVTVLALARIGREVIGGQALAPASTISRLIHASSRGMLVIRTPRFWNADRFSDSGLCKSCQRAISASSLLLGSRLGLAKTRERIALYDSIPEMQRNWRHCHFCETLLGQKDELPSIASLMAPDHRRPDDSQVFLQLEYRQNEPHSMFASLVLGDSSAVYAPTRIGEGTMQTWNEGRDIVDVQGISMAKFWISRCLKHPMCGTSTSLNPAYLPSRLLYVGKPNVPVFRLLVNAAVDRPDVVDDRYIALSHCWGGNIACQLTTNNYTSMAVHIQERTLPKNFLDAVLITRGLGIQYLWIDSLCIVQDSVLDWESESPMMGHIFANAYCVIAATASKNSHGGCLRARRVRDRPDRRDLMRSGSKYCYTSRSYPSVRTLFETRVEQAPLTQRAWAFQERLLARRLVHFASDTLLFECNTLQASEHDPEGVRYATEEYGVRGGKLVDQLELSLSRIGQKLDLRGVGDGGDFLARRGIRGALDFLQSLGLAALHNKLERIEFVKKWFDIVTAYSERALTRETDKLIALSGVAELVQERARLPYLAGLWHLEGFALPLQLLWRVKRPVRRQPLYCAPSWSWASAQGQVELLPLKHLALTTAGTESLESPAEVVSISVSWRGSSVASARSLLDAGMVVIRAPTWEARNGNPRSGSMNLYKTHPRAYRMSGGGGIQRNVRYLPDTNDPIGGNNLIAITLITARGPEGVGLEYGLVLTPKSRDKPETRGSSDEYERVGMWWRVENNEQARPPELTLPALRTIVVV
ncbi:heterokaryon incompatibility protein-domain-containing protein [Immersiella caudata]|uniref:Heterokaryon incompatibility protein-domain-containing protein n=1 Tax=Immersiella caudata TaxID=314043 RepID=A0AA39X4U1_9PEZI|nr:heterokaryon incompatibility protein-domain-containing protein [Immersiella caudata]